MLDILPRYLTMPDVMIDDMVIVVKEWLAWRLEYLEAPKRARADLRKLNDEVIGALPKLFRDHLVNPNYPYVADLPRELAGGDEIRQVLERRSFAVPFPGWRGDHEVEFDGPTHVAELNAADAQQRHLITQIWLEAEQADDPSLIASRCAVIDQIWDDAPTQVWVTAQSLSATGTSRLKVIDRLAAVWRRNLATEPDDQRIDFQLFGLRLDLYLRELMSITPTPRGQASSER